jgi:hypothetical protein
MAFGEKNEPARDCLVLLSFAFSPTTDITNGKLPRPPAIVCPSSFRYLRFMSDPRNPRDPQLTLFSVRAVNAKEQQNISNRGSRG